MSQNSEIEDPSHLTDADWVELNKIRREYKRGGDAALLAAWKNLMARDIVRAGRIYGAYFPVRYREALLDKAAEMGPTEEDLKEMGRKIQGGGTKH
jgi:hypothetical protein